jgi:SAM-dependent methyltransferase
MARVIFACPACAAPLGENLACPNCGRVYALRQGIYRFLLPEREQALAPFLAQYRRVRQRDSYRSRVPEYYRSLPQVPPGDPQEQTWRVRAATYRNLERGVLPGVAAAGRRLAVLDLGAGNGWLSHQLSMLGHTCAAVDWLDDAGDGLGAAIHHAAAITLVQADFDRLPFAPGQFDLVIYNASLHYSPDIARSLQHGCGMLRPGGALAIMDSPTFRSRASGERMVAEQASRLIKGGGQVEAIRPGQGYLLAGDLAAIGRRLGIKFHYRPTRGDLGWALRRRWAGFRLRREPASFGLWLGSPRS